MCNQTVCLIAAELERQGITTVCLMLLEEIAKKVKPPRVLVVPFAHGFPLGKPNDVPLQRRVMDAALAMLEEGGPPPVLRRFEG